jgi:hypothetical protein
MIIKELSVNSKVGDSVFWGTISGELFYGKLKEFDNCTAIIVLPNGKEKAVSC